MHHMRYIGWFAFVLFLTWAGAQATGMAGDMNHVVMTSHSGSSFMEGLSVFVLACFVGYHVVWRVTPALHSPLMAVTNAISSVIIVGALLAAGVEHNTIAKGVGFIAVVLASINIFGGFVVTDRMLGMFSQKKK